MTPHFTLEEFIFSELAVSFKIDNTPPPELNQYIFDTLMGLERIRDLTKQQIIILSGYRCKELNIKAGGSKNSQHMKGQAADIICPKFGSPYKLAKLIADNIEDLGVDQVILENDTWVHVSFNDKPRNQAMTYRKPTGYTKGIT